MAHIRCDIHGTVTAWGCKECQNDILSDGFGKRLPTLPDESIAFDPKDIGFSLEPSEETLERIRELERSRVRAIRNSKSIIFR